MMWWREVLRQCSLWVVFGPHVQPHHFSSSRYRITETWNERISTVGSHRGIDVFLIDIVHKSDFCARRAWHTSTSVSSLSRAFISKFVYCARSTASWGHGGCHYPFNPHILKALIVPSTPWWESTTGACLMMSSFRRSLSLQELAVGFCHMRHKDYQICVLSLSRSWWRTATFRVSSLFLPPKTQHVGNWKRITHPSVCFFLLPSPHFIDQSATEGTPWHPILSYLVPRVLLRDECRRRQSKRMRNRLASRRVCPSRR